MDSATLQRQYNIFEDGVQLGLHAMACPLCVLLEGRENRHRKLAQIVGADGLHEFAVDERMLLQKDMHLFGYREQRFAACVEVGEVRRHSFGQLGPVHGAQRSFEHATGKVVPKPQPYLVASIGICR